MPSIAGFSVSYAWAAAWAVGAFIIYNLGSTFLINRQHAAEARRLGCLPASVKRMKLPFGLDGVMRALKADRAKQFPNMLEDIYHEVGAATWSANTMGSHVLMTVDPKNIQAILATQFNDFELGPVRRGAMWPLFGNGIFTADGKGWFVNLPEPVPADEPNTRVGNMQGP